MRGSVNNIYSFHHLFIYSLQFTHCFMKSTQIICPSCRSKLLIPNEMLADGERIACPVCRTILEIEVEREKLPAPQQEERPFQPEKDKQLVIVPPEGSHVESYRYSPSVMEILAPRPVFNPRMYRPLLFVGAWFVFVLWLSGILAITGSILLLFTIPLFFVGLSMLYGMSKTLTERQDIDLIGNHLKINKTRIFNSENISIPYHEIEKICLTRPGTKLISTNLNNMGTPKSPKYSSNVPTVFYDGGKKATLLEYVSDREKQWAVDLLRDFISEVGDTKL